MKQLNSGFLLEQLIDDISDCKDVAQARRLLSTLANFTPNLERAIECYNRSYYNGRGSFNKAKMPYNAYPYDYICKT